MDNTRQAKVARQIQKDIADILLKEAAPAVRGVMVSVTAVRVSPDLNYAKVYFSIFPFERSGETMRALSDNNRLIRKALGQRIRNQVKTVPELQFFLDDSLEYIANIDNLLKEE